MKKILSLAVMAALCISLLTACGKKTVELDKSEHTFTAAGETVTLTADTKADELKWTSSDEAVATVDQNGVVTAVAPGSATITVAAGELSAACTVKCDWAITVELEEFYWNLYETMYPADAEGNPTGPAVDNIAAMPEMLDGWYPGLSAISTEQCLVYMPMMTGVPYELALIEVTNADDVEAVKTILQTRIDTEKNNQYAYPMVIENWELNSRIATNGNYILMAVTSDCDAYVDAFNALF